MWQPVLMISGFVMFVLGAMMMLPAAALEYYTGNPDYIFIKSSLTAIFFGGGIFLANYGKIQKISILQGYLITVFCWLTASLTCALPLYGNGGITTIADAIFEATSGVTATGATILEDIEAQPKSVLLWRSMLNGLGGIGIVIFAVALMPFLGIGGLHMFKNENSDTEDKFMPKFRYIAKDIIFIYIILNIACAGLLKACGMNWFDAVNHALATVCTGGFSTKNNSIAYFNSIEIEIVMSLFMVLGALPLTYFILITKNRTLSSITSNSQVNTLLKLILFYSITISLFYSLNTDTPFLPALRFISFNIISAITTTGFTSGDYLHWGAWAAALIFFLTLHGGCTGSTSGSIKIFRWQIATAFFKKNAITSLSPNQITVIKNSGKVIENDIVSSVFVLIISFLTAIMIFTLILSFSGLDFITSLGAVTATITSSGPGLTEATGPLGNYAHFTPFVKYILSFVMILGRLEVVTVFILLSKIKI